jgi:hypothetical protein
MDENNPHLHAALEDLDEAKRETLKRLIGTGAFIGPIVVSFAMADLSIDSFAYAADPNGTTRTTTRTTPRATTHAPTTTSTTAAATTSGPTTTAGPTTTSRPTTTARPKTTRPPHHPAVS